MSDCFVSLVLRDFWTDVVPDQADCSKTEEPFRIHSSCNGLLCVSEYDYDYKLKDVFLWNPCLRMSKKLPPPLCAAEWRKISMYGYCIVYDERNDDYKVAGLLSVGSPWLAKVEIYSLKNNSWKRIEDFKGDHLPWAFNMVYAYGKIHFVEYFEGKYLSIVSLDFEKEVYLTVGPLEVERKESYSCLSSVGVSKDCITALHTHARVYADVWVLREYGVKESWTKLVSIPYVDGPSSVCNQSPYHLLFIWNGKYLLRRRSHLAVYDPKDNSFVHHSLLKGNLTFMDPAEIYVESLVPLPETKL